MARCRWSREEPRTPGVYWVVLIPKDEDVAADDIRDMARGLRMDPRPPVHIAEIFPDDDEPTGLIPWIAGMDDACSFRLLGEDFSEVWWYGPVSLPPAMPRRGPVRPYGAIGLRPFDIPAGWPPEERGPAARGAE